MSIYLNRADFEYAAKKAGITDLDHAGEGYANPHTDMAYAVWLSVAFPLGDKVTPPLAWVNKRNGRAVGLSVTRPSGPESAEWAKRQAQGWEPSMPLWANVPAASPEVVAVISEHQHQRLVEGYSVESDLAQYKAGELARAAACYALQAAGVYPLRIVSLWPFKSPIKACPPAESLAKACALIFSEMERASAQTTQ